MRYEIDDILDEEEELYIKYCNYMEEYFKLIDTTEINSPENETR